MGPFVVGSRIYRRDVNHADAISKKISIRLPRVIACVENRACEDS